jgi:hypothetical protein
MILTPNFEQPTHTKIFWGFLPFQHQYNPTFILKHIIFVFSFSTSKKNDVKKFSVICILFFYMSLLTQYTFHKTFCDIFYKSNANYHSFFSTVSLSLSLSLSHTHTHTHTQNHAVHQLFMTGNMNEYTSQQQHFLR